MCDIICNTICDRIRDIICDRIRDIIRNIIRDIICYIIYDIIYNIICDIICYTFSSYKLRNNIIIIIVDHKLIHIKRNKINLYSSTPLAAAGWELNFISVHILI